MRMDAYLCEATAVREGLFSAALAPPGCRQILQRPRFLARSGSRPRLLSPAFWDSRETAVANHKVPTSRGAAREPPVSRPEPHCFRAALTARFAACDHDRSRQNKRERNCSHVSSMLQAADAKCPASTPILGG
jgi:hypothetical protein